MGPGCERSGGECPSFNLRAAFSPSLKCTSRTTSGNRIALLLLPNPFLLSPSRTGMVGLHPQPALSELRACRRHVENLPFLYPHNSLRRQACGAIRLSLATLFGPLSTTLARLLLVPMATTHPTCARAAGTVRRDGSMFVARRNLNIYQTAKTIAALLPSLVAM